MVWVEFLSFSSALPLGGSVGMSVKKVTCTNATTGQSIVITPVPGGTWNCVDAGLVVNPGNRVELSVNGRAD